MAPSSEGRVRDRGAHGESEGADGVVVGVSAYGAIAGVLLFANVTAVCAHPDRTHRMGFAC